MIFLLAIGFAVDTYAQAASQDTLPVAIRNHIAGNFAAASAMEWTVADSLYTGTFTLEGERHLIEFTSSGKLLSHRYSLKKDKYPPAISGLITKTYGKHKVDDVDYVEKNGAITYEVDLDGSPDYLLVFDSTGKLISSKAK